MMSPQPKADLDVEAPSRAAAMRHYQDVLHALVDAGAEMAAMVLAEARARGAAKRARARRLRRRTN